MALKSVQVNALVLKKNALVLKKKTTLLKILDFERLEQTVGANKVAA